MIVPMKKVSLIMLSGEKKQALKKLRRLGVMHIKITEGSGARLLELNEQIALLESGIFAVSETAKKSKAENSLDLGTAEAIEAAKEITRLSEEKKQCLAQQSAYSAELERLKSWGEIDLNGLLALEKNGIKLLLCEMSNAEFDKLGEEIKAVVLSRTKSAVRFAAVNPEDEAVKSLSAYSLELPKMPTAEISQKFSEGERRLGEIEEELNAFAKYSQGMKSAIESVQKEIEFETYATGMAEESLGQSDKNAVTLACLSGYIPVSELDNLKAQAKENSWGLIASDPTEEDDAPTKLENNRLVSLIYPLTDFLGTVPGYFEYDISAWFLGFILIFFGIIFGDGGYGLLICAAAAAMIAKAKKSQKPVPPAYLLIVLMGGATVLWGTLTCTWFGMAPEQLPAWLRAISLPIISNVNSDRIWYPFWTNGEVGLTTAQNLQIFCFSLALIQLSVAHIMGAVRNRKSLKMLGDIGSVLQLLGIFYVVLTLVVNGEVFGLGLTIGGFPVGTAAIALVGVGFVMSFVFANYEGSIGKSVLSSLKNIVSVLLGVVNVFSDIVSYIRLWAVGLAGAAISATVNELAGPMLGKLTFIVFAIILLVFGHGLNMILNVLSVIVHGVRLNTLEFSTHLDMSWSGHKYKPFKE